MNLLSYAPQIGIACLTISTAIAVYYFFRFRSERRIAHLWRSIAAHREGECRQWRETNFGQRLRLLALARRVRDFNLENEKE